MTTTTTAREIDLDAVNARLEDADAETILRWAVETFGPDSMRLASSMGAEDVVLIDMVHRFELDIPIFMLDTGRLHQETYDVVDRIRGRYDTTIEMLFPQADALQTMLREEGPNSFYDSIDARRACCGVRKLEPLARALDGADAWVTGLRRSQSPTRAGTTPVERDPAHDNVKINPLVRWSEDDVWSWIREHQVPYNALHDQGYPSIGCAPCTRAIAPGEDIRAGRWWWENPELRECGLHVHGDSNDSDSLSAASVSDGPAQEPA